MQLEFLYLLIPVWAGFVIAIIWQSVFGSAQHKIVKALIEKGADSPEKALSSKEIGVGIKAKPLLKNGSALRKCVTALDESENRASVLEKTSGNAKYYLEPEKTEKAREMFKRSVSPLKAALMIVILAAAFIGLWAALSFVFDASQIKLPFQVLG